MTVHFYDVGQALAVLVQLPDGRRILIDSGEQPTRAGCGAPCRAWSDHLLAGLGRDVPDKKIALLWISHQHSDHAGNAGAILKSFAVDTYVDNGTRATESPMDAAREMAQQRRTAVAVVDPEHTGIHMGASASVKITPVVPSSWPSDCDHHPNDCSIGLRIDYCKSSILFTGDAEAKEEAVLDAHGPVTLLQVGHHGSDTSSTDSFVQKLAPKWAVISAGKPGEGTNRTYCHPRASTVERLSKLLGGRSTRPIRVFQGDKCGKPPDEWADVDASGQLLSTSRDGDVVLRTTGDGKFERVP